MKADRLAGRAAEARQELPGAHALAQSVAQLVDGELGPFEVLLQKRVARLRDRLDETLAGRRDRVREIGRHGALLEGAGLALIHERLPGEHVDDAAELRLVADRQL